MFPDDWSKDKIKNEIAEAYSKKTSVVDLGEWRKRIKWTSDSWQIYEIIELWNGTIDTFYWIFE